MADGTQHTVGRRQKAEKRKKGESEFVKSPMKTTEKRQTTKTGDEEIHLMLATKEDSDKITCTRICT